MMSSRDKQMLDDYITGGRRRKFEEKLVCPKCGNKWYVTIIEEYGMGELEDEETGRCSDCGEDGISELELYRQRRSNDN